MGCTPRADIAPDPAQNPVACALFVTRRISSDSTKCDRLSDIAIIYAEAGQKGNASKILSEAYKVAKLEKKASRSYAMSRLAAKYAQLGEKDKAIAILSKAYSLTKRNKDPLAMSYVASKYAELEQKQKACKILAQAFQLRNAYAARKTKENYKSFKKYARGREIAESLGSSAKTRALVQIAAGYAEVGQYPKAFEVVKMIGERNHGINMESAKVLIKIAAAYAKVGEKDKATEMLPKAYQLVITDKWGDGSPRGDRSLLHDIAIIYAEVGQYDQAAKIANAAGDFMQVLTLNEISVTCAKTGRRDIALEILTEALQVGENISTVLSYWSKARALADVAFGYGQVGQDDKALKVLSQSLQAAKKVDTESSYKIPLLSLIAIRYAQIELEAGDAGKRIMRGIMLEVE